MVVATPVHKAKRILHFLNTTWHPRESPSKFWKQPGFLAT
jgi:hypothetical protein